MARRRSGFKKLLILALLVIGGVKVYGLFTGPGERTITGAETSNPLPLTAEGVPTYEDYAEFLIEYVSHDGGVDYANIPGRGLEDLGRFLNRMAVIDPATLPGDADRKAYFLNVTNALTMYAIAEGMPVEEVYELQGRLSYNYMTDLKIKCAAKTYSLEDLLETVIPSFGDPLMLLAASDGSVSGGRVLWKPYTGETLERLLKENAVGYLGNAFVFDYDAESGRVEVSSWFKKHRDVFGDRENLIGNLKAALGKSFPREGFEVNEVVYRTRDARLNSTTPCMPDRPEKRRSGAVAKLDTASVAP